MNIVTGRPAAVVYVLHCIASSKEDLWSSTGTSLSQEKRATAQAALDSLTPGQENRSLCACDSNDVRQLITMETQRARTPPSTLADLTNRLASDDPQLRELASLPDTLVIYYHPGHARHIGLAKNNWILVADSDGLDVDFRAIVIHELAHCRLSCDREWGDKTVLEHECGAMTLELIILSRLGSSEIGRRRQFIETVHSGAIPIDLAVIREAVISEVALENLKCGTVDHEKISASLSRVINDLPSSWVEIMANDRR